MQKPTKEKITSGGSREDDRNVLRGRSNRFFARCIFTWIEPWVFLGNVAGNERRPRFAVHRTKWPFDGRFLTF
jgi:hypothetical protein